MSLLPTSSEIKLLSDFVEEALRLYGSPVRLVYPQHLSMYLDNPDMGEAIEVNFLLKDNPPKKLLVSLGFWMEDKKTAAMIGYLPYMLNSQNLVVVEGCVLAYPDGPSFQVRAVNRQFLYGFWQVVDIVPFVKDARAEKVKTVHSPHTRLLRSSRKEVL